MRGIFGRQNNSIRCCSFSSIAVSLSKLSPCGNRLRMAPILPAKRPDVLALIGPQSEQASSQPADRTLIICSAPRTGSYELCRYLLAAGIGVPHEYFNPNYAQRLGERWGFSKSPLEPSELKRYIEILRRRRA